MTDNTIITAKPSVQSNLRLVLLDLVSNLNKDGNTITNNINPNI